MIHEVIVMDTNPITHWIVIGLIVIGAILFLIFAFNNFLGLVVGTAIGGVGWSQIDKLRVYYNALKSGLISRL